LQQQPGTKAEPQKAGDSLASSPVAKAPQHDRCGQAKSGEARYHKKVVRFHLHSFSVLTLSLPPFWVESRMHSSGNKIEQIVRYLPHGRKERKIFKEQSRLVTGVRIAVDANISRGVARINPFAKGRQVRDKRVGNIPIITTRITSVPCVSSHAFCEIRHTAFILSKRYKKSWTRLRGSRIESSKVGFEPLIKAKICRTMQSSGLSGSYCLLSTLSHLIIFSKFRRHFSTHSIGG
jgi:hypothetical protein